MWADESVAALRRQGGETEALARLAEYMADKKWVCEFEKPKGDPTAFQRPATTVLSPYLKFGCLSARLFHSQLMQIYSGAKKHTEPPVSLEGQLLWREFFYTIGASSPNFDKMEGNPICRQIPWEMDQERFNVSELSSSSSRPPPLPQWPSFPLLHFYYILFLNENNTVGKFILGLP